MFRFSMARRDDLEKRIAFSLSLFSIDVKYSYSAMSLKLFSSPHSHISSRAFSIFAYITRSMGTGLIQLSGKEGKGTGRFAPSIEEIRA